ncbi:unnamed protein product [Rotaria sp. Silwood1]|nr:unnamed protein product [Rotaria sp. Silwood1]
MDAEEFYEYLKTRYTEAFAIFVVKELQIMTPSILIQMTTKQIIDLSCLVYKDLQTTSISFYTTDPSKKNMEHQLKQSILVLFQILKKDFTSGTTDNRQSNLTNTSSELSDSDASRENKRMNSANAQHVTKRKRGEQEVSLTNFS